MTIFNLYYSEQTPLALFDGVEVSLVMEYDGECNPVCKEDVPSLKEQYPNADFFWSVYLHYDPKLNNGFGGVDCVADLPTEEAARAYASGLEKALKAVRDMEA